MPLNSLLMAASIAYPSCIRNGPFGSLSQTDATSMTASATRIPLSTSSIPCSTNGDVCQLACSSSTFVSGHVRVPSSGPDLGFDCSGTQSLPHLRVLRIDGRGGGGGGRGGRGGSTYRPPTGGRKRSNRGGFDAGQKEEGPPMNEQIRAPKLRVIGEDQAMLGEFPRDTALGMAREAGLDLVMIAPDAVPPVVRIVQYSKFKFEQQKRKRLQLKKAAANKQVTKELKIRYNIDTHDYDVKCRAAQSFLGAADRVKVTIQFKGREFEFRNLGVKLFERFQKDLGELAVLEGKVQQEARSMTMLLAPNKVILAKRQAEKMKKAASKMDGSDLEDEDEDEEGMEDEGEEGEEDDGEDEDGEEGYSDNGGNEDGGFDLSEESQTPHGDRALSPSPSVPITSRQH
eukprot:TRINITY_DN22162_c0_g1_i1.p1 TRINITY_DN22162_c0_g1~~TRINITY_DN22162_c0_g1_i1.p1  ORF type:complete len:400 (+),score=86.98 TRINITY_DN22162_c0_g1_i1:228-1427(+)